MKEVDPFFQVARGQGSKEKNLLKTPKPPQKVLIRRSVAARRTLTDESVSFTSGADKNSRIVAAPLTLARYAEE